MSLRNNILLQIAQKRRGVVFSLKDLVFPANKLANVTVVVSQLCKKGELLRLERGAYFKPSLSKHSAQYNGLTRKAIIKYLTTKYKGYVAESRSCGCLGAVQSDQVHLTIATKMDARSFCLNGIRVSFVKSYVNHTVSENCINILDAITRIKNVPDKTEQEVYDNLKSLCVTQFSEGQLNELVGAAKSYPPRVRRILGDLFGDVGYFDLQEKLSQTLCPTTRYSINYKKQGLLCKC